MKKNKLSENKEFWIRAGISAFGFLVTLRLLWNVIPYLMKTLNALTQLMNELISTGMSQEMQFTIIVVSIYITIQITFLIIKIATYMERQFLTLLVRK